MRVACAAVGGLGVDGVVGDGFGGKYEGAWWLASRHSRVGHVGAVVGREGRVVVSRRGWRMGKLGGGPGLGRQRKRRESLVED